MKLIEEERAKYSGETFIMCEYKKRRACDSFYLEDNNKLKKAIYEIKQAVKGNLVEEDVLKIIWKYTKEK